MALDEHYCDFAPAAAGRPGAPRAGRLGGGAARGGRQRLRRRLPRLLNRCLGCVEACGSSSWGMARRQARARIAAASGPAANLSASGPAAAVVPRPRAGPASERLRDPTCPPARSSGSTRRRVSASSRARTARTSSCTRTPSRPGRRSSSPVSAWSSASSPDGAATRRCRCASSTRCRRWPPRTRQRSRKKPDELVPIIEDLIKLLDDVGEGLRRGRHPDRAESRKVASVLRAVAADLEG